MDTMSALARSSSSHWEGNLPAMVSFTHSFIIRRGGIHSCRESNNLRQKGYRLPKAPGTYTSVKRSMA